MIRRGLPLLLAAALVLSGCTANQKPMPQGKEAQDMETAGQSSDTSGEESMYMDTTEHVIYLAGGCFWGMEQLMQSIPGVIDAQSGYANGTCEADADYRTVCKGGTGFRETVRVEYDPEQVSLDALLLAYFYVIDPTVENRQGNDVGSQYQTGVYYTNDRARETVERIAEIERGRSKKFFVEIGPLKNYYPAEEYHQDYLEKNPNGYCHIPRAEMELFSKLRIDPGDYQKPAAESIRDKLTVEQYRVTQENGTERPFSNAFWDQFEKGIYVDIVTGEPAAAGRLSQSPLKSLPWWSLRTTASACAAQRCAAAPETPTSGMCSPAIRNLPTACATASTARLSASSPMRRWRPRATDISCTCLRNEFAKYNDIINSDIINSVPIIMIRDAVVYAHVGLFKQDIQLAVQNQIGIGKRVLVDQIVQF